MQAFLDLGELLISSDPVPALDSLKTVRISHVQFVSHRVTYALSIFNFVPFVLLPSFGRSQVSKFLQARMLLKRQAKQYLLNCSIILEFSISKGENLRFEKFSRIIWRIKITFGRSQLVFCLY